VVSAATANAYSRPVAVLAYRLLPEFTLD